MDPQYSIVGGPSIYLLQNALFMGRSEVDNVIFRIADKVTGREFKASCQINQVGTEDGSRQSWLIWGYVSIWNEDHNFWHHAFRFEAYFRTDTRKGWLNRLA